MLENFLPKTRRRRPMPKSKDDQRNRFIEAARKGGASEDGREFDEALKRVASKIGRKPPPKR
jgi:general stress protein YciG